MRVGFCVLIAVGRVVGLGVDRGGRMATVFGAVFGFFVGAVLPAHATALGDLAAQMRPGEWRELPTVGFSGMLLPNFAGDGQSPFIEFTDEAQRNPLTRKIYILGCARGSTGGSGTAYVCGGTNAEDAGFVEYDEYTNSWRRMPAAPVNSAPHAYDHAAMNPINGDYYYIESSQLSNRRLWKLSGGVWETLPYPPNVFSGFGALEFFPDMNALVYVDGGDGWPPKVLTLPVGSATWTSAPVNHPIGKFSNFTEYSPKHKLLFFGGGTNGDRVLLKMDAQGRVTRCADAPIPLGQFGFGGRQTIDPVSGNLLALESGSGGPGTGYVYEYDPIADRWTKHATHPLGTAYGSLIAVFVPVHEHGVVFAVNYSGNSSKVYLYRHSPGTGSGVPSVDTTPPPVPARLGVK